MNPLLIGAALLGGGLGLKYLVDKKNAADAAYKNSVQQMAKELIKGKTYIVQFVVNPKASDWPNPADLEQAKAWLKTMFEQTGWKMLSVPVPRDEENAKKFYAGVPSEWVYNGQWLRDEKTYQYAPQWLAGAVPYLLPTA